MRSGCCCVNVAIPTSGVNIKNSLGFHYNTIDSLIKADLVDEEGVHLA